MILFQSNKNRPGIMVPERLYRLHVKLLQLSVDATIIS